LILRVLPLDPATEFPSFIGMKRIFPIALIAPNGEIAPGASAVVFCCLVGESSLAVRSIPSGRSQKIPARQHDP
jgi:hypothetical protein